MKKKLVNELRDIALQLPKEKYMAFHKVSFKKRDFILSDSVPNKRALIIPLEHKVNHLRRIKRMYLNGGFEAIKGYVSKFRLTLKQN